MVSHFQTLFDVPSLTGVYPRMNEVYTRLAEMTNAMRSLKDVLDLGSSDPVRPGSRSARSCSHAAVFLFADGRATPAEVVDRASALASAQPPGLQDLLEQADIDR